ncbi:MAG: hypothetical protein MJ238_04030 [Bacilli bacterium]|nr:hypothetical protein [Bacilli bacterium]
MVKFIKNFGLGLVYFLTLPILLVAVLGYLVYGIGAWLFYCVKGIIRFFKGDSFFAELDEDRKVREIKVRMAEASANPNPAPVAPTPTVSNSTTNANTNQTYNVTNNYFGQNPAMPNQGISTPNIGIDPNQQRLEMEAETIDLTASEPAPAQEALSDNLSNQQQIEGPSTPLLTTSKFAEFDGIDLSLDEEEK